MWSRDENKEAGYAPRAAYRLSPRRRSIWSAAAPAFAATGAASVFSIWRMGPVAAGPPTAANASQIAARTPSLCRGDGLLTQLRTPFGLTDSRAWSRIASARLWWSVGRLAKRARA